MVQPCRRCGQMHDAYTGCTLAGRVAGRATLVGEDEALVGTVVGRYQVGDVLGKGVNGTVLGVTHLNFPRAAALKLLRPSYASPDLLLEVLDSDVRAAWAVAHPGLCEVFDLGALSDGTPFFVMERLEGETLATRISRERLSIASAIDVVMQLLSAVAAAHARDLLLLDLRPQNIFLAHRRGCRPLLKVLDFGLARLTPLARIRQEWDALRATVGAADAVGSTAIPYYLSPERAQGDQGLDVASDLFVAAIILYEVLAGERPFLGGSFDDVLGAIRAARPVPLTERRSDVSPELSAYVARSLSPNPRERPTSAKEMQDELRALFEGQRKSGIAPAPRSAVVMTKSEPSPASAEPSTLAPAMNPQTLRQAELAQLRSNSDLPRPNADPEEDAYAEETQTKREPILGAQGLGIPRNAALGVPRYDEASAENADRTVPPPPPSDAIDVDVSFEEPSERTAQLRSPVANPDLGEKEEETETMELTPELRARVDQMMAARPAPVPAQQPVPPQRGAKRRR